MATPQLSRATHKRLTEEFNDLTSRGRIEVAEEIERAREEDKYGDVVVDTAKSREVYREWMAKTRPGPNAEGLRRPLFMMRPVMPQVQAYYVNGQSG